MLFVLLAGTIDAAPVQSKDSAKESDNYCEQYLEGGDTSFPFLSSATKYNDYSRCYMYIQCLIENDKMTDETDIQSLSFFGMNNEILKVFQRRSFSDSIASKPVFTKKLNDSELISPSHYLATIKNARVLILNDDHSRRETRAFFLSLLPHLKEMGYNYLAMEALIDTSYIYPSYLSGFYFQEPIMAEIYREATRLGMKLIKYEYVGAQNRDSMQAVNLYKQIKNMDSTDKVVVFSGQSHLWEDCPFCPSLFGKTFKHISHINPVTIDQTRGLSKDYYPDIHFDITNVKTGGIIPSSELNLKSIYGCSFVDAFYIHPKYEIINNRQSWLSCGGIRKPYRVKRQFKDSAALIQVYYAKEVKEKSGLNYITPADMVSHSFPDDVIDFYLVPGYKYILVYRNVNNQIIFQKKFIF